MSLSDKLRPIQPLENRGGIFQPGQYICQKCGEKVSKPDIVELGNSETILKHRKCGGGNLRVL